MKLLHENMGIVEKIEYSDLDNIKIYYDYKDEDAIKRLILYLSNGIQWSSF
jgi:hypothetical protein